MVQYRTKLYANEIGCFIWGRQNKINEIDNNQNLAPELFI